MAAVSESYNVTDTSTTYKVTLAADNGGSTIQNPWFIKPSAGSPSGFGLSLPMDENLSNVLFVVFIMFLGGLFSYYNATKGTLIVTFVAGYLWWVGLLTIAWWSVAAALTFAIVINLAEGA